MTDHTTLIAELRERAEWARAELNQAAAECFDKAADALGTCSYDYKSLIEEAREAVKWLRKLQPLRGGDMKNHAHVTMGRLADALEETTKFRDNLITNYSGRVIGENIWE